MVSFFAAAGLPCPSHANPLKFYCDAFGENENSDISREVSRERVAFLTERYKRRKSYEAACDRRLSDIVQSIERTKRIKMITAKSQPRGISSVVHAFRSIPSGLKPCIRRAAKRLLDACRLCRQSHVLTWRKVTEDKVTNIARLLASVVTSVALAVVFGKVPYLKNTLTR
jgi:hypothetical protein